MKTPESSEDPWGNELSEMPSSDSSTRHGYNPAFSKGDHDRAPQMNPIAMDNPWVAVKIAGCVMALGILTIGYQDFQEERRITKQSQNVIRGLGFVDCIEETTKHVSRMPENSRPKEINDALHLKRCWYVPKQ